MTGEAIDRSAKALVWHKSSHSAGNGGECVEVASGSRAVHVRDSKDREGPILTFEATAWSAFIRYAAASRL